MEKKLKHVVLLAFNTSSSPAEIAAVVQAFVTLKNLKEVAALEWGTNVSPENHAQGYTHCFLLTFTSETDRDTYLKHPRHSAFGEVLKPHLANVCVVDYWS